MNEHQLRYQMRKVMQNKDVGHKWIVKYRDEDFMLDTNMSVSSYAKDGDAYRIYGALVWFEHKPDMMTEFNISEKKDDMNTDCLNQLDLR